MLLYRTSFNILNQVNLGDILNCKAQVFLYRLKNSNQLIELEWRDFNKQELNQTTNHLSLLNPLASARTLVWMRPFSFPLAFITIKRPLQEFLS